jgi:predicted Zn-dependent protease
MSPKRALTFLALVFIIPSYAARMPGTPLRPGFNLFTRQQDVELGREAAVEVRKQVKITHDPFLQDYVSRIGRRLADTPEARESEFTFSFTVITDPKVNAFALPGGTMFIQTGLLQNVDNEAQLAGAMAHEMSHVILRHGTSQASKANLIQLPAMLAEAVVGNNSMLAQLTQIGVGLGANSVLLHYSRGSEDEADALGSHLMSEAGYDPIELARFFDKLNAASEYRGAQVFQFLSDHPNPGNREQAIGAEIRTLPRRSYGFETGDFQRMKTRVGGKQ